jgi:hypothetical protein
MLGYGMRGDAFDMSDIPPHDAPGMAACLLEAIAGAGIDPGDVRYLNVHGTATKSNDPAEAPAIRKVFGHHLDELRVSGVKGSTGHMLGGSGALGGREAWIHGADRQAASATARLEAACTRLRRKAGSPDEQISRIGETGRAARRLRDRLTSPACFAAVPVGPSLRPRVKSPTSLTRTPTRSSPFPTRVRYRRRPKPEFASNARPSRPAGAGPDSSATLSPMRLRRSLRVLQALATWRLG